jgi:Tfp pilus assembly protein PilV
MNMKAHTRSAFTLIEVTLSLGVTAFCLLSILGLLPVGLNSNQATIEQTAGANILTTVAADLRSTPNPAPKGSAQSSLVFGIPIPAIGSTPSTTPTKLYIGEGGQLTTDQRVARYQLNVWMTAPATGSAAATSARVLVTWPAQALYSSAAGSMETVIALDRN